MAWQIRLKIVQVERDLNRNGVVKKANLAYRRQYLVTYLLDSYLYTAGE